MTLPRVTYPHSNHQIYPQNDHQIYPQNQNDQEPTPLPARVPQRLQAPHPAVPARARCQRGSRGRRPGGRPCV
eukprot:364152-Chlamydomonas_euryale.AAC.1